MTWLWVIVTIQAVGLFWAFVRIGQLRATTEELAKVGAAVSKLRELLATVEAPNWKAFVRWRETARADVAELQQRMDMQ